VDIGAAEEAQGGASAPEEVEASPPG